MNDIAIYAGDTVIIDYTIILNDAVVDLTGLTLKWAARLHYGDEIPAIEKVTGNGIVHVDAKNGKARLTLMPEDTANLAVSSTATLVWALRLYDNDNIHTVAAGLLIVQPVAQR